jgi:hypothetical protein
VTDPAEEIRRKLTARELRYVEELASAETEFFDVAESVLTQWGKWWRDPKALSELAVEARLHDKFVMCFPLAAHAMNHIEAALAAQSGFPWIAKSSTRIAFEHSLTAQWVLMTADGERKLKAGFDNNDHIRSARFVKGVQSLGRDDASFAQAAHGLTDAQLSELVRARSDEPGPSTVEGMCQRFASGGAEGLLYDICRELSGSVHPSLSLLRAVTVPASVDGPHLVYRGEYFGAPTTPAPYWNLAVLARCIRRNHSPGLIARVGPHVHDVWSGVVALQYPLSRGGVEVLAIL